MFLKVNPLAHHPPSRNENTTTGNRKNFSETCKLQNRIKGSDIFHMKRLLHESPRVRMFFEQIFFWLKNQILTWYFGFVTVVHFKERQNYKYWHLWRKMVQFHQYLPTNQNYGRKHPDQTKHLQVIKGGRGASCNETYFQFQFKIYRKFQVIPHQSCKKTLYST